MVLSRAESLTTVETVARVREISRALSRQAGDLYRNLARRMTELDNEAARDAFERIDAMTPEEQTPEAAAEAGGLPTVFDGEDVGTSRLVTPYAAFSLAVRNQERAFAFWTYVSANSADPEVRSEAERLARDELARVKTLRAARREAYHASRPPAFSLDAFRAASTEQLTRKAAEMEAALADLHERIAAALETANDPRAPLMRGLAAEEQDNASRLGIHPATDPQPK